MSPLAAEVEEEVHEFDYLDAIERIAKKVLHGDDYVEIGHWLGKERGEIEDDVEPALKVAQSAPPSTAGVDVAEMQAELQRLQAENEHLKAAQPEAPPAAPKAPAKKAAPRRPKAAKAAPRRPKAAADK